MKLSQQEASSASAPWLSLRQSWYWPVVVSCRQERFPCQGYELVCRLRGCQLMPQLQLCLSGPNSRGITTSAAYTA